MTTLLFFLQCFWFIFPAGFANMAPVFVKKLKFLAVPLDFNKNFRGKPVFGRNKTWRGLIAGLLFALIVFIAQKWLYQFPFFEKISLINYNQYGLLLGLLLGLGAIFGDLTKSFLKRRLGITPGRSWIPFDQIDWVLGAMLFSCFLYVPSLPTVFTAMILGLLLHPLINYLGFLLKLKENKF